MPATRDSVRALVAIVPIALALTQHTSATNAQAPATRIVRMEGYLSQGSDSGPPLRRGAVVLVYDDSRANRVLGDTVVGDDGHYALEFPLPLGRQQVWVAESDYRCHRSFHPRDASQSRVERHGVPRLSECDSQRRLPERMAYQLRWGLARVIRRAEAGDPEAMEHRRFALEALQEASPAVRAQLRDYGGTRLPTRLEVPLREELDALDTVAEEPDRGGPGET